MPEADANEVADYAKTPEIKIVKHTDTVHAVAKPNLDMLGVVFFAPDTVEYNKMNVSADKPCVLAIRNGAIYLSDITQTFDSITVTVNGKEYTADLSKRNGLTVKIIIKG